MSQNSPKKATSRTPEAMRSATVQAPEVKAVQTQKGKQHKVSVVANPSSANVVSVQKTAPPEEKTRQTADPYKKPNTQQRFGLTATLAACALVIVGLLMLGQKFQPATSIVKATSGQQALELVLAGAKNENWRAVLQHVKIEDLSDSLASQLADAPDSAYASHDDLKKQLNVDMSRIHNAVVNTLPATSPVKAFITQLTGDKEMNFGQLSNVQNEGDIVRGDVTIERPDLLLTSRLEAVVERQADNSWQLVNLPNVLDVLREVEAVKQVKKTPEMLEEVYLANQAISTSLQSPKAGSVMTKVPYMQNIRTKALPKKGGILPLELAITFNNTTQKKANLPWRVTFKDKAGQVLGAYELDAQTIAKGSQQKHVWNIALPTTGKGRHIHALPLGSMVVSLIPLG